MDSRQVKREASKDAEIARLRAALKPFADRVYNDNGDVTTNHTGHSQDDYWQAYCAMRPKK